MVKMLHGVGNLKVCAWLSINTSAPTSSWFMDVCPYMSWTCAYFSRIRSRCSKYFWVNNLFDVFCEFSVAEELRYLSNSFFYIYFFIKTKESFFFYSRHFAKCFTCDTREWSCCNGILLMQIPEVFFESDEKDFRSHKKTTEVSFSSTFLQ